MPDNDLSSLLRLVQRADEFSLVVALVAGAAQRKAFLQELAEASGNSFPFLDCDEPTYDPLPRIRRLAPQLPKGIPLILTGMEAWMRRQGAEGEPFWANLNSAREELREILPRPLVLLLPSFLFAEASRAAPDLLSGTSLVFTYQPEIHQPVYPMLWLHYPAMAGLTTSEKRSRLEQFRKTPKPSAREIYVELELRWWLGQNLSAVRRLSTALRRSSGSTEVNRALLMLMTFLEPNLERYYIWCSRLHTSFEEDEDLEAEYELASHLFQMHRDLGNRQVAADVIDHMRGFEASQSEPEAARIKLYFGILALDGGDLEPAEWYLESALSEREKFYGRLHPFTLEVDYALACVAESQGRIREALERVDKLIRVWNDLVAKRHSASRKMEELYRRLRRTTG